MPSIPVIIDTMADIDFHPSPAALSACASTTTKMKTSTKATNRNLLLAPPSIAVHEEKLRELYATYDRSKTDLQMLDRLSAGFVALPPSAYDLVLVLTDTDGARRAEALQLLDRDVYATLVPAMKAGAKLQFQDGQIGGTEMREAVLAGLVERDGGFQKLIQEETIVPLRFGGGKKNKNRKNEDDPQQNGVITGLNTARLAISSEYHDGDELIDEDTLLTEEDLKRPLEQRTL